MTDSTTLVPTRTAEPTTASTRPAAKRPWLWQVILHDDEDHSYGYVLGMLHVLFGKSSQEGYRMACEVDHTGRVICDTTHRERAEFKRDQILGYGADPLIPRCQGSMTATIQPSPDPAP